MLFSICIFEIVIEIRKGRNKQKRGRDVPILKKTISNWSFRLNKRFKVLAREAFLTKVKYFKEAQNDQQSKVNIDERNFVSSAIQQQQTNRLKFVHFNWLRWCHIT